MFSFFLLVDTVRSFLYCCCKANHLRDAPPPFFPSVCSLTSPRQSLSDCCVSKPENLSVASCQANERRSPDAALHNWFACLWDKSKWEIQPASCHGAAGGVNTEGCSVGWIVCCCFFHFETSIEFCLCSFLQALGWFREIDKVLKKNKNEWKPRSAFLFHCRPNSSACWALLHVFFWH